MRTYPIELTEEESNSLSAEDREFIRKSNEDYEKFVWDCNRREICDFLAIGALCAVGAGIFLF